MAGEKGDAGMCLGRSPRSSPFLVLSLMKRIRGWSVRMSRSTGSRCAICYKVMLARPRTRHRHLLGAGPCKPGTARRRAPRRRRARRRRRLCGNQAVSSSPSLLVRARRSDVGRLKFDLHTGRLPLKNSRASGKMKGAASSSTVARERAVEAPRSASTRFAPGVAAGRSAARRRTTALLAVMPSSLWN